MRRRLYLFMLFSPPIMALYLMGFLNKQISKKMLIAYGVYAVVLSIARILFRKNSFLMKRLKPKDPVVRLEIEPENQQA